MTEKKCNSPVAIAMIHILVVFLWSSLVWYYFIWFATPLTWFKKYWINEIPESRLLDGYDAMMLFYILPPLAAAIFAHVFLSLMNSFEKSSRQGQFRRILPSFTRKIVIGPFGTILTVGEIFWGMIVCTAILWIVCQDAMRRFQRLNTRYTPAAILKRKPNQSIELARLENVARSLGFGAFYLFIYSMFMVSRNSVLLKVSGISFESAVRYHRWMSHGMLTLSVLHWLGYWINWIERGIFIKNAQRFQLDHVNFLAGEILLAVGLIIWITSIGPIRRRFFELFYYTHHIMYFAWFMGLVLHLGDWAIVHLIPPLVFYGLDRVIRMYQSMNLVQVEALTVLPDKSVSLDIPISQDFKYKAMDVIFVNVPSVSYLQWHPFSITSSPLDNKDRLNIVVKPTGHWTNKLHTVATSSKTPLMIKTDGPYGHPQEHFYNYDSLILVAGGIGITPLLSLLKEILHRAANGDRVPSYVRLVWATKSAASKKLLDGVQAVGTLPDSESAVRVKIDIHLTEEKSVTDVESHEPFLEDERVVWNSDRPMQPRAGSGSELVSLAMLLVYCGFAFAAFSVVIRSILKHDHEERHDHLIERGVIYYVVYLIAALIGGSLAVLFWWIQRAVVSEKKNSPKAVMDSKLVKNFFQHLDYHIGRPSFREIFDEELEKNPELKEVGVIASGPDKMVKAVGATCKELTPILSFRKKTIFNFHDVSFVL